MLDVRYARIVIYERHALSLVSFFLLPAWAVRLSPGRGSTARGFRSCSSPAFVTGIVNGQNGVKSVPWGQSARAVIPQTTAGRLAAHLSLWRGASYSVRRKT